MSGGRDGVPSESEHSDEIEELENFMGLQQQNEKLQGQLMLERLRAQALEQALQESRAAQQHQNGRNQNVEPEPHINDHRPTNAEKVGVDVHQDGQYQYIQGNGQANGGLPTKLQPPELTGAGENDFARRLAALGVPDVTAENRVITGKVLLNPEWLDILDQQKENKKLRHENRLIEAQLEELRRRGAERENYYHRCHDRTPSPPPPHYDDQVRGKVYSSATIFSRRDDNSSLHGGRSGHHENFTIHSDQEKSEYSNANNISAVLQNLNWTLEKQNRSNIKLSQKYMLTQQSDFRLWYDHFETELKSNDLLDVIKSDVSILRDYSFEERMDREYQVRSILINRIDRFYHNQVVKFKSPQIILQFLKNQRKIQSNTTYTTLKSRLWKTRMFHGESCVDYFARFDALVNKFDNIEGGKSIDKDDIRAAFYNSVVDTVPLVDQYDLGYAIQNKKEMPIKELKDILLQIEARGRERREIGGPRTSNNNNYTRKDEGSEGLSTFQSTIFDNIDFRAVFRWEHKDKKFHNCDHYGHIESGCPVPEKYRYCNNCKCHAGYKGKDCPLSDRSEGKNYFNENWSSGRDGRGGREGHGDGSDGGDGRTGHQGRDGQQSRRGGRITSRDGQRWDRR